MLKSLAMPAPRGRYIERRGEDFAQKGFAVWETRSPFFCKKISGWQRAKDFRIFR